MFKIYLDSENFVYHSRECSFDPDPGDGVVVDRMVDPTTECYINGVIEPRPAMPITVNGCMLNNVPEGAIVKVDNLSNTIMDDSVVLELVFDTPGEHIVKIHTYPYLDYEVIIET